MAGSKVASKASRSVQSQRPSAAVDFPTLRDSFSPNTNAKPDVIVGLTEGAIQKFLVAHYNKNKAFYDRSRRANPDKPLYDYSFNDHGVQRRIRFWAKVEKTDKPAVTLDLNPDRSSRFAAWWRATYGRDQNSNQPPPNAKLIVPKVTLQINIPKLSGQSGEHEIDVTFAITVSVYIKLVELPGQYGLKLVNWDITIEALNPPPEITDPAWGGTPGLPCKPEVDRLRSVIRDLITVGAKVALSQLATSLTLNLPLPPLNVIKGIDVRPHELTIAGGAITVGFLLQATPLQAKVDHAFQMEMLRFNDQLGNTDLFQVMSEGPLRNPEQLEKYLRKNVPAYQSLDDRHRSIISASKPKSVKQRNVGSARSADLLIGIEGRVFDIIAKTFLKADKGECTDWIKPIDVGAAYLQGRACYWLSLFNARGSLSGTTVEMGVDLRAGGKLDLRACIRIPCADDECATWSPGIGLAGPWDVKISLDNKDWDDNKALRLKLSVKNIPKFEAYGLPPGVDEVVNALLEFLSNVILKGFLNAVLASLDFYLVELPVELGEAKVKMKLSQLRVANVAGALVLTSATAFD